MPLHPLLAPSNKPFGMSPLEPGAAGDVPAAFEAFFGRPPRIEALRAQGVRPRRKSLSCQPAFRV